MASEPPLPEPEPGAPDSIRLVRSAKGGDEQAFNRLFERYQVRVMAIVRRRLGEGLRNELDSGDILQESMLEAVRDFDRFELRSDKALIAWFAAIVENRIRAADRHTRAQKRDRAREVSADRPASDESMSPRREPSDSGPGPSSQVGRREELEILRRCLEELPEDKRKLITLREEGASWEEVAAAVGCPSPDAARMLYSRTKIELHRAFVARRQRPAE